MVTSLSLRRSYITLKEQHLVVFLFLNLVQCPTQQRAIRIYLEYGPESKWKHGSPSWMRFMPKVASSSARFGTVAGSLIKTSQMGKLLSPLQTSH
uniref:Uncharacterized protein n=1 Tax=Brassica campestris TaxID=3711 RepID=A0A3P5YSS2_BRACM|nr:unnamed protein product [Brassica rapa]